jgi:hypothetical protein
MVIVMVIVIVRVMVMVIVMVMVMVVVVHLLLGPPDVPLHTLFKRPYTFLFFYVKHLCKKYGV